MERARARCDAPPNSGRRRDARAGFAAYAVVGLADRTDAGPRHRDAPGVAVRATRRARHRRRGLLPHLRSHRDGARRPAPARRGGPRVQHVLRAGVRGLIAIVWNRSRSCRPTRRTKRSRCSTTRSQDLGLRAVMCTGLVQRPLPGDNLPAVPAGSTRSASTAHDYDPLWQRFVDLDVTPTFHSTGMGWGSRVSPTSYVANHLGSFGGGRRGAVPLAVPRRRDAPLSRRCGSRSSKAA